MNGDFGRRRPEGNGSVTPHKVRGEHVWIFINSDRHIFTLSSQLPSGAERLSFFTAYSYYRSEDQ